MKFDIPYETDTVYYAVDNDIYSNELKDWKIFKGKISIFHINTDNTVLSLHLTGKFLNNSDLSDMNIIVYTDKCFITKQKAKQYIYNEIDKETQKQIENIEQDSIKRKNLI